MAYMRKAALRYRFPDISPLRQARHNAHLWYGIFNHLVLEGRASGQVWFGFLI